MKIVPILTVIAATSFLVGCVPHMSKAACMSTDWHQMGYGDGSAGHNQRDLSQDIEDCAKFKIKVNSSAYQAGWHSGVRVFCSSGNGFTIGTEGQGYNHICPPDLVAKFEAAYQRGLRRYCTYQTGYNLGRSGRPEPGFCAPDLQPKFDAGYQRGAALKAHFNDVQNNLNSINSQVSSLKNQIGANQAVIARSYAAIHAAKRDMAVDLNPSAREADMANIGVNYDRIHHLQYETNGLQDELNQLMPQQQALQAQYDDLKNQL